MDAKCHWFKMCHHHRVSPGTHLHVSLCIDLNGESDTSCLFIGVCAWHVFCKCASHPARLKMFHDVTLTEYAYSRCLHQTKARTQTTNTASQLHNLNLLSLCAFHPTVEFTETGISYSIHRKSQTCWCCTMLYTTSTVCDCSRWCFSRTVDYSSHPRSFSSFLLRNFERYQRSQKG